MRRRIAMMIMAMALASAGACGKTKDTAQAPPTAAGGRAADTPPGQASGQAQGQAAAQDTAQAGPVIADEDIPVETDFEDEADEQITADTYRAELEALEKEIATEP